MSHSAIHIIDKLCQEIFHHTQLSYFTLNKKGVIQDWGGHLGKLNMPVPKKNTHIKEVAIFMEGILPLAGKSMEFSCIKLEPDTCINALLFKTDTGYGLIIWDASRKNEYLTQTQQQINELSLLIEEQKNRIFQTSTQKISDSSLNFIEDFFLAMNFAVLEMNEQGHFVLMGTPPSWISQLPQSGHLLSGEIYEDDIFSFLGNFIQEAKIRWQKNPSESFKSGIWVEKDHTGQEYLFEATGICVHGKKLMIIANDVCHPNEKQSIIQKGRDLALQYHDLKKSGLKLKSMHDELEKRVKERTKDLELANKRLEAELIERKRLEIEREEVARQLRQSRKMEAIGTLAGGIAHDFNNILSAIIGFTELSLIETPDQESISGKLNKILDASNRAKDLIQQILTFSHQSDYEKKPLKLKILVKEVLNLLRASLPAIIEIREEYNSSAYILADPTQIHQVIMNLCTNAWHAMQEQGGTIFIRVDETDITDTQATEFPDIETGRLLILSVRDTGCGIPSPLLDRIFDPYFTTKDINKGTGLGLSAVHGIIRNCKGYIQVESQENKGSEFRILLPAFDSAEQTLVEQPSIPMGNQERIMFVDDEVFQTQMTEELLERLGYLPTVFNDSQLALDEFNENPDKYDLVITDVIMPKMTGKMLAEKILAIRNDIPVILCSGYSNDINTDTIQSKGINHYLMKPVTMENLAKTIASVLKKQS